MKYLTSTVTLECFKDENCRKIIEHSLKQEIDKLGRFVREHWSTFVFENLAQYSIVYLEEK